MNYLSNESGDTLLKLIHDFCERHPTIDDIFLHKKYRSINECIGKAMNDLYEMYDIGISYPTPLLGITVHELGIIQNMLRYRGGGSLNSISMKKLTRYNEYHSTIHVLQIVDYALCHQRSFILLNRLKTLTMKMYKINII